MQSVNYTTVTYTIKNRFIFRNNNFICSLKKDWYQCRSDSTWWENICETFKTIGKGQLESIQKRQKFAATWSKLARLSGKKIPMFRNALLIIYFSPHFRFGHQIFAFWEPYGWTSRAFWRSNITCNQKYCFQQEPLDCLHLMLLSGNWFSICLCNSEETYWWELLN